MDESSDLINIQSFYNTSPASPCLVSFEYGSLVKNEASSLRCSMYADKNSSNKQTLVVSKGNQCYKGKLNSKSLCHTLLLIRNKKTNKARVISAFSCMLQNALKERSQQKSTVHSDNDYSTNISNLNQTFGSKKAKRYSELSMRMKINTSGLQDDVKEIISDINLKRKDLVDLKSSADDTIIQLIPPCNRDANKVEDVYKIEDLLSETEMNSLEKSVKLLADENEKKSEFLEMHLNLIETDAETVKLKLLIYADSLLKFINMGAIEIKNKNCLRNICPLSRVIGTKILNEFTVLTGNTRNRPVSYKDKAVCYMMVSILLACNYKINLEAIFSLLKGYHQKKLLQLCKVVGVVSSSDGKQKVSALKVPLPSLPTLPMKKK